MTSRWEFEKKTFFSLLPPYLANQPPWPQLDANCLSKDSGQRTLRPGVAPGACPMVESGPAVCQLKPEPGIQETDAFLSELATSPTREESCCSSGFLSRSRDHRKPSRGLPPQSTLQGAPDKEDSPWTRPWGSGGHLPPPPPLGRPCSPTFRIHFFHSLMHPDHVSTFMAIGTVMRSRAWECLSKNTQQKCPGQGTISRPVPGPLRAKHGVYTHI